MPEAVEITCLRYSGWCAAIGGKRISYTSALALERVLKEAGEEIMRLKREQNIKT